MVSSYEKMRLTKLFSETLASFCRIGINDQSAVHVDALIGVTLRNNEVLLIKVDESLVPVTNSSVQKRRESNGTQSLDAALHCIKNETTLGDSSDNDDVEPITRSEQKAAQSSKLLSKSQKIRPKKNKKSLNAGVDTAGDVPVAVDSEWNGNVNCGSLEMNCSTDLSDFGQNHSELGDQHVTPKGETADDDTDDPAQRGFSDSPGMSTPPRKCHRNGRPTRARLTKRTHVTGSKKIKQEPAVRKHKEFKV